MADGKTDLSSSKQQCLDLGSIEAIASERGPDRSEQDHLNTCTICRRALDDFIANARLLARFRRVIGAQAATKATVPDDLVPGYRILEEISRGSQGVVYKAVQERTKRVVAVKMLLHGSFATEKQRRRFEREVEIAAALKHPGIVTIYDVTPVRGGRYAYAMEYLEGVHLDAWRPPGRTARERREAVIRLFIEVCDAAQYAHNNGVMHRDLKPANIIVDGSGRPHVLDFGIAKAVGSTHGAAAASLTNEFAGTLAFASPEQVAGNPDTVDSRADVYSLGVILFLLICGRPPYPLDGSILDVAARIGTEDPIKPRSIDASIEPDLEAVMLHALRKDPAQRYQSPGALQRDLGRFLAGDPVTIKRDSGWYMFRKMVSRHRSLITVLLFASLLIVASIAAVAYSSVQTVIARGRATSERERAAAETERVAALSSVLGEILPPARVPSKAAESRYVDDGLQRLRGKIELGYFADEPAREAAAQTMLGLAFRDRGNLPFAEEALRLALSRLVAEHGEQHPAVAQAMHDLAGILLDRGRLWEAESYCVKAIQMRTAVLGESDLKTAETLELRARIQVAVGNAAEALASAQRAEGIISRSGGDAGLTMAQCLDTLSAVYLSLDRGKEAEEACRRALAIRLNRLSDDDPGALESLNRFADVLTARGDASDSSDLVGACGTRDPVELAARLRAIGSALSPSPSPDNKPAADEAVDRALDDLLALKRALLGPKSRGVGQTLAGTAWRLLDRLRYRAAEAPLREAISILEAQYGPTDLVVANCLERLSETLSAQHRFKEAAESNARELDILRGLPSASLEGINAGLCQRELGRNLTRTGHYDDAIVNFRQAMSQLETMCGPLHHSRGLAMSQCAIALLGAGRPDEAETMAREGRKITLLNLNLPADQRMQVDAALGIVLAREGKLDEAEPLLISALEYFKSFDWPSDIPEPADFTAIRAALTQVRTLRGEKSPG